MKGEFSARPVVVLGFGAAGVNAVLALRESGYDGGIIVVTDVQAQPYSPVLTSYYAGGRITRDQCFIWNDLHAADSVDQMLEHARVSGIDALAHDVVLADGRRVGYSKLVIATGAHPVAPGFPVVDSYRPLFLRTMEDADRLSLALTSQSCKNVLVSGTSMVGLKAVEACLDRGVNVTLLGRSPHVLRGAAHRLVAERFESLLAERGVKLRLEQTISNAQAKPDGGYDIVFSAGDKQHFDEVILAQGVKPNLDFAGEDFEIDQGLVVDRFMRTNVPDVYAAGDVAQALDVSTGEKRVIGLWQNAVQQGRCAGRAIAEELAGRFPTWPFPGSIPCNTIHVRDILFASVGSVAEQENRHFEVSEADSAMEVRVYEESGANRLLVGANLIALTSCEGGTDSLDIAIGAYRREILNSYLT